MEKVVVGLSGGVDSSIAAHLLKEQGYEVHALFMKNWEDQQGVLTSNCTWEDDLMFAEMTASKLNIPLHFVDFSKEYRQRVVNYMFDEYKRGRTPNPDVLCNREVKFDLFAREAEKLGADYIATGHYCKKQSSKVNGHMVHSLFAGEDSNKEQSYFLCQVSQAQLAKALFPLGELHKSRVRELAHELGLATATRKDSQGICFIGKVNLPDFLQQKLKPKKGKIIQISGEDIEESRKQQKQIGHSLAVCQPVDMLNIRGKAVGEHQGAHYFTIGQRKGLNVGGTKEPLYVLATDTERNIVYVGEGAEHPGLFREGLFIPLKDIHWIREDLRMATGEEKSMDFRIRYRQPLQRGKLLMRKNGAYILFENAQRGVTPGQFAAWYVNQELLGSGVIA